MKPLVDGGSAFPRTSATHKLAQQGMSLRDYFAAAALPAALSEFFKTGGPGEVWGDNDDLARTVYGVADAMLKAREAKS